MEKVTELERFKGMLAKYQMDADDVAFINHKIELLTKKAERRKEKKTPTQLENDRLANLIYDAMEEDTWYKVPEIRQLVPDLDGMNPQKIAGILNETMYKRNLVSRENYKGTNRYMKNQQNGVDNLNPICYTLHR